MPKYYICNDIRFLIGMESTNIYPKSGTHMRLSKAENFISTHPNHMYYKTRTTSKGNDYVICTPMKFVGRNNKTISIVKNALPFETPEAAYDYLDSNREVIDQDIKFVVDGHLNRVKRSNSQVEQEPEFHTFYKMASSDRIVIPKEIRDEVYRRSKGICPICNKALSKYNYTIDHINPLSRGGTNEISNLRAVHIECNRIKGNMTDKEMLNNVSNIVCTSIYNNPYSGSMFANMFRSFVRGVIREKG